MLGEGERGERQDQGQSGGERRWDLWGVIALKKKQSALTTN